MIALVNPFDMRGPEFLLFYVTLGSTVVYLQWIFQRLMENARGSVQWAAADPYALAVLRAGDAEAVRVAVVALIDRGLIKAADNGLICAAPNAAGLVRNTLDREILRALERPEKPGALLQNPLIMHHCEAYRRKLIQSGLLADSGVIARRTPFFLAVVLLLGLVSRHKISLALARGRHNIQFLVVLTTIFLFISLALWLYKRTAAGNGLLGQAKITFKGLKDRLISPGGASNELSYLAAVYGLTAVPELVFPFMRDLRGDRLFIPQHGSGCSGGGCSSGSGCGGGGCGGGCGGCGG